jgi:hypothetical protein
VVEYQTVKGEFGFEHQDSVTRNSEPGRLKSAPISLSDFNANSAISPSLPFPSDNHGYGQGRIYATSRQLSEVGINPPRTFL